MIPEILDAELTREPFAPLRLHMSDGTAVEIHNPGLAFISRGALYIARTDRPHSRIMNDFQLVSLRHVVRLEALEAAAP